MRLECASKLYYIPEISIQHGEIIISRQKALGKFEKFKNLTCYIVMSGSNATCSTNSQQSDLNDCKKFRIQCYLLNMFLRPQILFDIRRFGKQGTLRLPQILERVLLCVYNRFCDTSKEPCTLSRRRILDAYLCPDKKSALFFCIIAT